MISGRLKVRRTKHLKVEHFRVSGARDSNSMLALMDSGYWNKFKALIPEYGTGVKSNEHNRIPIFIDKLGDYARHSLDAMIYI